MALVLPMAIWVCLGVAAAAAEYPQVTVVQVRSSAIDVVTAAHLIVDHVDADSMEVYVRADQWQSFLELKLPYTVLEHQPRAPVFQPGAKGLGVYHSYVSLTTELQSYATAHPAICRLSSLGQSVQGRELWAIKITDNPDDEEDEPEFKYISTMHGDEPVGTEMCIYLMDRLLNDYGTSSRITDLVDETEIWIVPLMNPDGLVANSRFNAQGLDLNREFPIYNTDFTGTAFDGEALGSAGRPPEVVHVMDWSAAQAFVHAANFHTGSVVVNYPYDDDGIASGLYAACPDDSLYIDVSLRYSVNNPPMYASNSFPQGITNGCDWYRITGGMQDWNYRYLGGNETTIELATPKRPLESQLPAYWANNEESMLSYLEATHVGIRGLVVNAVNGQPVYASITVQGNPQRVYTDPDVGDYHRMLLPGTYTLVLKANGYFPEVIGNISVSPDAATRVDVALMPLSELPLHRWSILLLAGLMILAAGCTFEYARSINR